MARIRITPDHMLGLAAAVCFSSVAAVTMHFNGVAFFNPAAFYAGVAATAMLTIPVVLASLRVARAGRSMGWTLVLASAAGAVVAVVVSCLLAATRPNA